MTKSTFVSIDAGGHRERVIARRDALIDSTYRPGRLPLVERIAREVARTLPPCFDLDDLIGVGNLALIAAATRYRPELHDGTPFEPYARHRIRGAILESVRRNKYAEATRPGIEDMAGEETVATLPDVARDIDARRMARKLAEAISWLPEIQQEVLKRYYGAAEPSLEEVAARLGFSPTKTRELRAKAVEGLRQRFKRAA
jgi:RNA polymerase sigma factor (sigma-70 family)